MMIALVAFKCDSCGRELPSLEFEDSSLDPDFLAAFVQDCKQCWKILERR